MVKNHRGLGNAHCGIQWHTRNPSDWKGTLRGGIMNMALKCPFPFEESIPLSYNPLLRAAATSMRSIQNADVLIR
jgi:hypothetical protein